MTTVDFEYDALAENQRDFYSDAIETVAYDRDNKELFVEFQSGGAYVYEGVEESTYNVFVTSPSLGRFYQNNISGEFTSRKVDAGSLTEKDYIKPEQKWLTNPGGDEPDLSPVEDDAEAQSDEPLVLFSPGGDKGILDWLNALTVDTPVHRFTVRYTVEAEGLPNGPFEPEFEATSEDDALAQFEDAIAGMARLTGLTLNPKVQAVTHYFD